MLLYRLSLVNLFLYFGDGIDLLWSEIFDLCKLTLQDQWSHYNYNVQPQLADDAAGALLGFASEPRSTGKGRRKSDYWNTRKRKQNKGKCSLVD
jgi:hypothetical protein